MNQLPPSDGDLPALNPAPDDPHAGFALNGYLRLIKLQNQALRKLAAHLDSPPPPPVRDASAGPAGKPS